ncbi:MAG: hypothetical protein LC121_17780 [Anaerolineae bacterium]|nr:hypothetical protein [Anaerolineae bacterium]
MHNPEKAAERKAQRQAEYLRVVSETGSMVQARRKVGVTSKTVANWRLDSDFVAAVEEALEESADAIRAKVREMALAGDTSMLALSMKVIEPALRPAGNQVAVQVNAGSAEARLAKQLPDDQLIERARQILDDTALRRQAGIDVVDVVEAPEASQPLVGEVAATEAASASPGGSGSAAEPSAEDLI